MQETDFLCNWRAGRLPYAQCIKAHSRKVTFQNSPKLRKGLDKDEDARFKYWEQHSCSKSLYRTID